MFATIHPPVRSGSTESGLGSCSSMSESDTVTVVETEDIKEDYAILCSLLKKLLRDYPNSVDLMKTHLQITTEFDGDQSDDFDRLFEQLFITSPSCNFFSHSRIKKFIEAHLNEVEVIMDRLNDYKKKFLVFLQSRIVDGDAVGSAVAPPGYTTIRIKWEREFTSMTYRKVVQLVKSVCHKVLKIDYDDVIISFIQSGCVEITIHIPQQCIQVLSSGLSPEKKQILAELDIVKLSSCTEVLYGEVSGVSDPMFACANRQI